MNLTAWIGLAVMVVSEAATLARIEPFWSWNTPIAWTGFILFADGIVWQARRNSWIRSNGREFVLLALASIPLWLVFEGYNRIIRNWYYTGLPENFALRMFGYAWSFATIWPAIFEGAELVAVLRAGRAGGAGRAEEKRDKFGASGQHRPSGLPGPPCPIQSAPACSILPFVVPAPVAVYMAAPVWLGFIFLLDPLNARLGGESLVADLRAGRIGPADQPRPERSAVRRALGILELLGGRQVALHGADHGTPENVRDAGPWAISASRRLRSNVSRCMCSSARY